MQEAVFSIRYDPGTSSPMDVYHQHPDLTTWSSWCFITDDAMWRIDHECVGNGVVFLARRTDGEYRWRVLYPAEYSLGTLYDDIESMLREGLSLELLRLSGSSNWRVESLAAADLSYEHREALEAAVKAGYYQRPREVSVAELAEGLDVPRSTLQYRLRTAEDTVIRRFVENAV